MRRGAKLFIEMVPLSAEVEAETVSPSGEADRPKTDVLLSFLTGALVAGVLLATGGSVGSLLAGAF